MGETDRVRAAMKAAAVAWAEKTANDLLGRAQRAAPIEEGTLRASGSVDVDVSGQGVTAKVSFSTPYAARQHEETSWSHPKGGEAKYLENALKEQAPKYEASLAAAVARAI